MIPWQRLDSATIPGGGELRLMRRGEEYSIMLGTNELMNSRLSGSEEALASLALERLADVAAPSVLIGGLGMGFTLRAALRAAPSLAKIVVVELVPAVVAWARGAMAGIYAGSLDDERVILIEDDVGRTIRARRSMFDAILLDVDNGPDGLTRGGNDGLYGRGGLRAAREALRPNGVLAIWSAAPDEEFRSRLELSGFKVEEVRVRAHRGRAGARHVIWLAVRPE